MHQGGCQCGELRYQYEGEPLTCYACHCTDCQTSTGSAFTLSMIVNSQDIQITKGEAKIMTFNHNGHEVQRYLCGHCGSTIWIVATGNATFTALKPGTFDDTKWFKPVAHLWLRSAQPWLKLDDDLARFETQPEMSELAKLWAENKTR